MVDSKKGQQLTMSIARHEQNPEILKNYNLEVIDLRKDWQNILNTIYSHQHIQRAIEKAYQDFPVRYLR